MHKEVHLTALGSRTLSTELKVAEGETSRLPQEGARLGAVQGVNRRVAGIIAQGEVPG